MAPARLARVSGRSGLGGGGQGLWPRWLTEPSRLGPPRPPPRTAVRMVAGCVECFLSPETNSEFSDSCARSVLVPAAGWRELGRREQPPHHCGRLGAPAAARASPGPLSGSSCRAPGPAQRASTLEGSGTGTGGWCWEPGQLRRALEMASIWECARLSLVEAGGWLW